MPHSVAEQLETKIRNHRLIDFPVAWADELIFPYYDDLSLPNIAHSIANALGHPMEQSSPLLDDVWQADVPSAKRVVTFLMDGMGYQHLNMLMAEDDELRDAVTELNGGREVVPLTSVAPSTTAVALTSLWTGVPTLIKSGIRVFRAVSHHYVFELEFPESIQILFSNLDVDATNNLTQIVIN